MQVTCGAEADDARSAAATAGPSRAQYRRRQLFVGSACSSSSSCSLARPSSLEQSTRARRPPLDPRRRPTTTTTIPPATTTTTDPGLLPQTSAQPPSDDQSLSARLSPLFSAITTDSSTEAQTVFFPESAYLPTKQGQIPDPSSDYQSRLIGFLNLDLAAYHQSLGPSPTSATFVGVLADPTMAQWIPPGTCENSIGYWHLPNVRLVYKVNGMTSSFAVASLISWRGVWYVVHLGPNPRTTDVGTVALPSSGPGSAWAGRGLLRTAQPTGESRSPFASM